MLNAADLDQSNKLFIEQYDTVTEWNGPHPINQLQGTGQLFEGNWAPLKLAVPDISRKVDILMGGRYNDVDWVTSIGYLTGTFVTDWLRIPIKGKSANIVTANFG